MQRVDRILAQAIDTGTVPGVVAMAATDAGVAYAGAFGVRTADGAPMGLDSVVWLASMTKPITSIAALQLVEQGRIGLDDPVGEVVPELVELVRRFRGAQKRPTKKLISLRLDGDVIDHFRAKGKGWQSRVNATLRKASGL